MELRATVLIPTHDHGPTLLRAVRTVFAQTVRELELFIIGDGISPAGREIATALQRTDPRVRFFDHPKGPRHGERYRHDALQQARGRIVCYLSDDDLWLPHHVETMERLLEHADFAHTLSVRIEPDGSVNAGNDLDFSVPGVSEAVAAGLLGGTGLSCMGHTLALYRQLPDGWDTTPLCFATDTHMCQKLVRHPGCRPISGTRPTLLRFGSATRSGWSTEQRVAELDCWSVWIADAGWRDELPLKALDSLVRADAGKRFKMDGERRKRRDRNARIAELSSTVHALRARVAELGAQQERAQAEAEATAHELSGARNPRIAELSSTVDALHARVAELGAQQERTRAEAGATAHQLSSALAQKVTESERLIREQAQLVTQVRDAVALAKQRARELSRRTVDLNRVLAERDQLTVRCRQLVAENTRLARRWERKREQCKALLAERDGRRQSRA